MTLDALLLVLRKHEVELHQPSVRHSRERLEELIHPEFLEFGRSGRTYTRADILASLPAEQPSHAIHAQDFKAQLLAEGVALLTYKSAHVEHEGKLERFTLRASIWKLTPSGRQMVFHQGTPTEPFDQ